MGSKKTLPLYYPFISQTISGTATYTSPSTSVANIDNLGVVVSYSGTPTGVLSVQGSNDNSVFISLTFAPVITQPSGAALNFGINLNQFPWPYIQFSYTNATGSGTLSISITGKDLN